MSSKQVPDHDGGVPGCYSQFLHAVFVVFSHVQDRISVNPEYF